MGFIIVDAEDGHYAHAEIKRYLPMNEHIEIPFRFRTKDEAMNILNKMPFPEWQFYEIVED